MQNGGWPLKNMCMRKALLLLTPLTLFGLNMEPWFCNLLEFTFTPSYTYSKYRDVQNGHPQLSSASHDHLLTFDLSVPPVPQWEVDFDLEFADTPRQSMGFRSSAVQVRYLCLDDIIGDPVSLTLGSSVRGVSHHSLHDVSCPYHSRVNFEINSSLGREWDTGATWRIRTYGFASLGLANRGFPWTRGFALLEGHFATAQRLALFGEGYFGLGPRSRVNTRRFNGYAFIHHQSVDVGLQYTYHFEIWGHLSLAYTRRLYAHSFPKNVNFFTVSYMLPFSLF